MKTADRLLAHAMDLIDAANAEDPNREPWQGDEVPGEWLYGLRMSEWLEHLLPEAPDHLRLAARAQHTRRWQIPRNEFPDGRRGYLDWRTRLYAHHADVAEEILRKVGYSDSVVARVRGLLMKKGLRSDPDMQWLEDVICLVFLQHYFAPFAERHDDEKLVRILRRTWRKMSPTGQREALSLHLPDRARVLIRQALDP